MTFIHINPDNVTLRKKKNLVPSSESRLLFVRLQALSPFLVRRVGRSPLSGDFSFDSAPASALHGASPSEPADKTSRHYCIFLFFPGIFFV